MEDVFKDERFAHIGKDPRFRNLSRKQRKVKIDKRFQGMFNDEKFKLKYSVDKRGRPLNITSTENLKKFYDLPSEESDLSDSGNSLVERADRIDSKKKQPIDRLKKPKNIKESHVSSDVSLYDVEETQKNRNVQEVKGNSGKNQNKEDSGSDSDNSHYGSEKFDEGDSDDSVESVEDDDDDDDDDDETSSENEMNDSDVDYARGTAFMESSSEESDASDDEQDQAGKFEHKWGEMDKEAPVTEEITNRLAVCNMDWDRINAKDIMVLLNSFKPSGGNIKAVYIYPSEFGKERMKKEEVTGPTELIENAEKSRNDPNEEEYHKEILRQYQLNRLKYFYAVAECDTAETANHIYEQCDGMEYQSSGNVTDLRFIPNEMTFDDEPKSVATELPDTTTYKPTYFVSSALQQSTVECTWDETDPNRTAVTMRKFDKDDLEEMDLKDYLASDSDADEENPYGNVDQNSDLDQNISESEDEEEQIAKYRNLLKGLDDNKKDNDNDMEMEITWEPGLKETTEEIVKKQTKEKSATIWEKYLEKKKEKKKKKREEKKKKEVLSDASEQEDSDIPSDVDLNDPYFKEELDNMKSSSNKDKKSKKKKKHIKEKLTPEEIKEKEEREAELKLLLLDEDDKRQHFNLKNLMESDKKKKKKLSKKKKKEDDEVTVEDSFKLDMQDPRFNVLFENPHYNIDPSAPEFKKTKAMDSLIEEKLKRAKKKNKRKQSGSVESDISQQQSKLDSSEPANKTVKKNSDQVNMKDMELSSLVKSVKVKTKMAKSKQKR